MKWGCKTKLKNVPLKAKKVGSSRFPLPTERIKLMTKNEMILVTLSARIANTGVPVSDSF